jgi:hypothetical protein
MVDALVHFFLFFVERFFYSTVIYYTAIVATLPKHANATLVDRIYNSLVRAPDGTVRELPLVIPRPVPGLMSRRVLVQDFLHGVYFAYEGTARGQQLWRFHF